MLIIIVLSKSINLWILVMIMKPFINLLINQVNIQ